MNWLGLCESGENLCVIYISVPSLQHGKERLKT